MYVIAALAALAQETHLDIFRLLVEAGSWMACRHQQEAWAAKRHAVISPETS